MANKAFDNAKKKKADEFYTQMSDIDKELTLYRKHFEGKVIFCNCDDPYESEFFKYFASYFNIFKIKKLIATCYRESPIAYSQITLEDILSNRKGDKEAQKYLHKIEINEKPPYRTEITEVTDLNQDGGVDIADVELLVKNDKNVLTFLEGDGDFRSNECIELMKEADIVVTNPPFSLFREFVAQLMEYNKKFIIIGNTNALTYKEIFKLMKENKMWIGYTNFNVGMYFYVPDDYENYHKIENGHKMVRVSTSCWFTNIEVKKHNQKIKLYKKYSPEKYPHYENYDAINIDNTNDIPEDWYGEMGVPITFFDKYNPEQFEIIALGITGSIDFTCEREMEILKDWEPTGKFTINAKGTLYRKYNPQKDTKPPAFKDVKTGEYYSSIYARIIIKRKDVKNED
jgi:hypothetical protein